MIDAKHYQKIRKDVSQYLENSLRESINANNLGMILTAESKWTQQQKFDYVFNVIRKTTEALYKVSLCYGKLVLAYSGTNWKQGKNGKEQSIISNINKALEKNRRFIHGLDFDVLRNSLETIQILKNFFANFENQKHIIRKFTFKLYNINQKSNSVILKFKEINISEPSKSFDITINSLDFLKIHAQFCVAYTFLESSLF